MSDSLLRAIHSTSSATVDAWSSDQGDSAVRAGVASPEPIPFPSAEVDTVVVVMATDVTAVGVVGVNEEIGEGPSVDAVVLSVSYVDAVGLGVIVPYPRV